MDDQQLALALGKLQGLVEAQQLRHKATEDDIGNLTKAVAELTKTMQAVLASQAEHAKRLNQIEPDINDWRRARAQGMGMLALAGLVGGLVISFGKEIFHWVKQWLTS